MKKFDGIPHLSGTKGGHTINLHQFARDSVTHYPGLYFVAYRGCPLKNLVSCPVWANRPGTLHPASQKLLCIANPAFSLGIRPKLQILIGACYSRNFSARLPYPSWVWRRSGASAQET